MSEDEIDALEPIAFREKVRELRTFDAYKKFREEARDLGLVDKRLATRREIQNQEEPPPLVSREQRPQVKPPTAEDERDDEDWSEPIQAVVIENNPEEDTSDDQSEPIQAVVIEKHSEEEWSDDWSDLGAEWSDPVQSELLQNDELDDDVDDADLHPQLPYEIKEHDDRFIVTTESNLVSSLETNGNTLRFNNSIDIHFSVPIVVLSASRSQKHNLLTIQLSKAQNHATFMNNLGKSALKKGYIPPFAAASHLDQQPFDPNSPAAAAAAAAAPLP